MGEVKSQAVTTNCEKSAEVIVAKGGVKKRQLGIPTVVGRFVQQVISQVQTEIYEPQFSDHSFGFRPNRSAHEALFRVQQYGDEGYRYCVGLDLERFFDTMNHSKLIEAISRTIKDGRAVSLIHCYLNAGVMVRHKFGESFEGVLQGGPLNPILNNILLNEMDGRTAISPKGRRAGMKAYPPFFRQNDMHFLNLLSWIFHQSKLKKTMSKSTKSFVE